MKKSGKEISQSKSILAAFGDKDGRRGALSASCLHFPSNTLVRAIQICLKWTIWPMYFSRKEMRVKEGMTEWPSQKSRQ